MNKSELDLKNLASINRKKIFDAGKYKKKCNKIALEIIKHVPLHKRPSASYIIDLAKNKTNDIGISIFILICNR